MGATAWGNSPNDPILSNSIMQVVIANAYHHRSDAWSSLVALVGIGGAMVGYPWLDPLAGLVRDGYFLITYFLLRAHLAHVLDTEYVPQLELILL